MRAQFRLSNLIPAELKIDAVHHSSDVIVATACGQSRDCRCPECGTTSSRVHSRYPRTICDLPCTGRRIELHLTVRRFVCSAKQCRRKIFAERFGDHIVRPMARRTARLETLVHHLALALLAISMRCQRSATCSACGRARAAACAYPPPRSLATISICGC